MSFNTDHEMHKRRFGRNVGVGLCLTALIALLFGLTMVKIEQSGPIEGFDHAPRATALPPMEEG